MASTHTLWVPDSAKERVLKCTLCGTEYSERQKLMHERHVINCAKRSNEDVIGQAIEDKDESVFTNPKLADPERYNYERAG
jgi:DNA-directed RNA polymerase subunit M/transcription elongation factor TFIIS